MLGIRTATVRLSIDTKLPEYSDVLFENFILFFLFLARESDNNVAKHVCSGCIDLTSIPQMAKLHRFIK